MEPGNFLPEEISQKLRSLHMASRMLCDADPAESLAKAEQALALAQEFGIVQEVVLAKENMAYQIWHGGDIDQALALLEETRAIRLELRFFPFFDWCIKSIALIHWGQGNFDLAFHTIYEALPLIEETGIERDKCLCYWALGVFYFDLKDFERSYDFYSKSLLASMQDELLDNNITAYNLIGLGCCSRETGARRQAVEYFEKALAKGLQFGQWMQRSRCFYEIGLICQQDENHQEAAYHLSESLKLRRDYKSVPGIISCLMALADTEKAKANFSAAIEQVEEALIFAERLGSKTKRFQCYEKLATLYRCTGDFEHALINLDKFHELRSEVYGERSSNRIKQLESNFARLQSEKEAEIQRLINVELKDAHDLIKSKNQKILDSVHYARLIQQAILPSDDLLNSHFPEHFLLFLPKDIVAGDFYWTEQLEDKILFAVADCTGHGVPGAMMSVMCSTALTRSVKESSLASPGKILDKTALIVAENFSRSQSQLTDGMHIALCCFEPTTMKMSFAGAYHSCLLIRGDSNQILTADKQPIGSGEELKPFGETQLDLMKGDCLYLFSDGYADQFGGPEEKKIKASVLRELLYSIRHQSLQQQKESLLSFFENWKGKNPQTDDVCVMGIRF